jgi:ADP-heptose:LPS heptosyltransferase
MAQSPNLAAFDARRVCVIKPSAFGCVVQSLPLIGALRRRFPTAEISWVIRDDLLDLVSGHPDLAECLVFERHGGPRAWLGLLRQFRSRQFDLAIDLQGLLRSGLMTLATRAAVRIGLETAREGASLACNVVISGSGRNVPAADRYWRVAEALGVGAGSRSASVAVPRPDREWARLLLDALPRPVIAVHAGAMWTTKRCPPELFADTLRRAHAQFGGSNLLVGAAGDAPTATRIQTLLHAGRPVLTSAHRPQRALDRAGTGKDCTSLTGATTLKQLAALLAGVDVLLCNDSGPMHLAAAMGTPVVGLFTCTSPKLSGPSGGEHAFVTADVPCAGAYRKSCPWQDERHLCCQRAIPADAVFRALSGALGRAAQRRSMSPREWRPVGAEIDAGVLLDRRQIVHSAAVT